MAHTPVTEAEEDEANAAMTDAEVLAFCQDWDARAGAMQREAEAKDAEIAWLLAQCPVALAA